MGTALITRFPAGPVMPATGTNILPLLELGGVCAFLGLGLLVASVMTRHPVRRRRDPGN